MKGMKVAGTDVERKKRNEEEGGEKDGGEERLASRLVDVHW